MASGKMKLGETLLFGGFALIGILAFIGWLVLENVRKHLDKPMYSVGIQFFCRGHAWLRTVPHIGVHNLSPRNAQRYKYGLGS